MLADTQHWLQTGINLYTQGIGFNQEKVIETWMGLTKYASTKE